MPEILLGTEWPRQCFQVLPHFGFGPFLSPLTQRSWPWTIMLPSRRSPSTVRRNARWKELCVAHMGPEDPSNRKKYPSFLFKPNCRKLQNISKSVSLKIGSKGPQKFSQIFKNGEKLHYKISRSKGAKYTPKSDFRGPKIPPEVRVGLKTCSTICGTPVQAILDEKSLTRLAGGVREGQNMAQNVP